MIDGVRIPADPRLKADIMLNSRREPATVAFRWSGRDLKRGSNARVRITADDGSFALDLGETVVGTSGRIDVGSVLPSDLTPGDYTFTIDAVDVYGVETTAEFGFTITSEWSPSDVERPDNGSGDGSGDGSGGGVVDGDGGESHGLTGLRLILVVFGVTGAIAGLLALGGWFFIIGRRRRDDEEESVDELMDGSDEAE